MRIAKLKFAAVLTVGMVAGFGAAVVGRPGQEKQSEAAKPHDPTWSAYPDLRLSFWDKQPVVVGEEARERQWEEYEKFMAATWPLVYGEAPIRVNETDTVVRLLKGQLEEARNEIQKVRVQIRVGRFTTSEWFNYLHVHRDIRDLVLELWADAATREAWLREVVVLAKEAEWFSKARTAAGTDPQSMYHAATRNRMAAEAALWKVKNPRVKG